MMNDEVERFFAANVGRWAPRTQKNYARSLYKVSEWLEAKGVVDPEEVTTILLLECLEDWSMSSRRSAIIALRVFFRWSSGDLSPAAGIRLPKMAESSRRALNAREVLQMLAVPDTSTIKGRRNLAILALTMDTGLRNNEICNALLTKLQLRERTLEVVVKGGRWEGCVFSEYTQRALEAWISVRVAVPDEQHIFVSLGGYKIGTGLGCSGLTFIIRSISRQAGLRRVVPHELRHSFAVIALRAGSPTRILQKAGRWRDIRMVEHYTSRISLEEFEPYFPMNFLMDMPERRQTS